MLGEIPLFACLSDEHLSVLASRAMVRSFPSKTVLVNDGDLTDSLYVIRSGRVKVYLSEKSGKEIVLNCHGPGEYFGELALLDDAPRSASVVTTEVSEMVVITRRDFDEVLDTNPEMARQLLRGLTGRLRSLTENVRSLALMDVYGRVARMLLTLSTEEDGVRAVRERLTQQDMANRVGASREMVSRVLNDLTKDGFISIEHGMVYIHESPLEDFADKKMPAMSGQ